MTRQEKIKSLQRLMAGKDSIQDLRQAIGIIEVQHWIFDDETGCYKNLKAGRTLTTSEYRIYMDDNPGVLFITSQLARA